MGGGPAGSFFSYFVLELADRAGLEVEVDVYESRDFNQPSPQGCNMCGGIVSESLVQHLGTEGITLPETVVQRGIDSYVLHMDVGSVSIATPLLEMRIGAVHRGAGPRDAVSREWESFDGHLLAQASGRGAKVVRSRVEEVTRENGRPVLHPKGGEPKAYDLVVVAIGVNSATLKMFEALGVGYTRPKVTRTLIREYRLGREVIARTLGSSMHVFLLDLPRLEFAAIIPKGDYVTACLLGEDVDIALMNAFLTSPEVRACMPEGWRPEEKSCQCLPFMNVLGVEKPFADRFVFIGDCGVTRLYKDGIGAAYRTAKAAASAVVFDGISAEALGRNYLRACRRIANDNRLGTVAFSMTRLAKRLPLVRRAILRMAAGEQTRAEGRPRRMSAILWDLFSGSASYQDILQRMLHPAVAAGFVGAAAASLGGKAPGRPS